MLGLNSWAPDKAEHLKVPCASTSCWLSPSTWHRELLADPAGLRLPLAPNTSRQEWQVATGQDFRLGWSALACPSLPAACSAPRQRLRNSEQRKWQPHVEPLLAAPRVTASPAGRASFPSGSREGKLPQQSAHQQKGCGCRRDTQLPFGSAPKELSGNCARRVEWQGWESQGIWEI